MLVAAMKGDAGTRPAGRGATRTSARPSPRFQTAPRAVTAPLAGPWSPDIATSDAALRRFLHGLPGVDQVGVEARAASLATRSIKREAKLWALDAAISMIDLTTLNATRWRNVLLGGVVAGIAGAYLTVGSVGAFGKTVSSGLGFIALAAVAGLVGRGRPPKADGQPYVKT